MSDTKEELILRYAKDCETFDCFATNLLQRISIMDIAKVLYNLSKEKLSNQNSNTINLPYDLSKDTLIKVKDYDNAKWELRYFKAFSEDGVECYVDGRCSTEIEDPEEDYIVWKYAKLLTSNDIAMINFL